MNIVINHATPVSSIVQYCQLRVSNTIQLSTLAKLQQQSIFSSSQCITLKCLSAKYAHHLTHRTSHWKMHCYYLLLFNYCWSLFASLVVRHSLIIPYHLFVFYGAPGKDMEGGKKSKVETFGKILIKVSQGFAAEAVRQKTIGMRWAGFGFGKLAI